MVSMCQYFWAILFWLNILAITGKTPEKIVRDLWKKYGRIYTRTYNYHTENTKNVNHLLDSLTAKIPHLINTSLGDFTILDAQLFNYIDPVTGEQTTGQGIMIELSDNARIFVRPSGTNSSGATLKVYLSQKSNTFDEKPEDLLKPLEQASQDLLQIKKYLGNRVDLSIT